MSFDLIALLPYDIALFNAVMKCLSEGAFVLQNVSIATLSSNICPRGPLFFKTASAESLSSTSRAASMMSRVQGITHERDESESDERDNTRSTRNTREKIPELEMIDQSTGGDLFLMFLGQGRSEFA